MSQLLFHPYRPTDAHAVREVFYSNVPHYFQPEEEAEFWQYVHSGEAYFVAEETGTVVAAGGFACNGPHMALCWGMVHQDRHRQGIGRAFTAWRLAQCREQQPQMPVRIDTSQHTATFYAALGFTTLETQPDYFSPGLDLVRMELPPQPAATADFYDAARAHLSAADPVLARIIAISPRHPEPAPHEDMYIALLRAIVSQQISTKAAAAIWKRFTSLFKPEGYPEPRILLEMSEDQLREVGLSRQKAGYLKAIAEYNERGQLDYEHLTSLSEEEFTQHLTAIRGVGRWTAQMLQMFALDQPDVFSEGDLGVQNAMRKFYQLEETGRALQKKMLLLAEPWRPYRSLACKYLWLSLDNGTQLPPII